MSLSPVLNQFLAADAQQPQPLAECLRGVVPLANVGNTCFMNTNFQCVNRLYPISDYLSSGAFLRDLNVDNALGSGGTVAKTTAEVFRQMWANSASSQPCLRPTNAINALNAKLGSDWHIGQQHDQQEALNAHLDYLSEDLNRVTVKQVCDVPDLAEGEDEVAYAKSSGDSWREKRVDSFFHDQLRIQVMTTQTCEECGWSNTRMQSPSTSLQLYLPTTSDGTPLKNCSLDDCFKKYCTGVKLEAEDRIECPRCIEMRRGKTRGKRTNTIISASDILVIQLVKMGHTTADGTSRIGSCVGFNPDAIDLKDYISTGDCEYEAVAIGNHVGNANSGHCFAYVRSHTGEGWIEANDSQCSRLDAKRDVVDERNYLLYLKRKKAEWALPTHGKFVHCHAKSRLPVRLVAHTNS